MEQIKLGDLVIPIIRKDIKSVNIRLYPPDGEVRITASVHIPFERIEAFVLSKREWILRRHNVIISSQPKVTLYQDGESHYYLGKPYQLRVVEGDYALRVEVVDGEIVMFITPSTTLQYREALLNSWYAERLEQHLREFIPKWEEVLKVKVRGVRIKNVKTKWGSCNVRSAVIMFNLQLMQRPVECIEYIVVHELTHLLERGHNARFYSIIEGVLPHFRLAEKELKRRY